jgi:hypothetical protein
MKLVLLAAGIVGAAAVAGVPTVAVTQLAAQPVPAWAPWVGVALFGAGIVVHDCAHPRSAAWILLVLYVAYAGQVLGGLRHPSGPPARRSCPRSGCSSPAPWGCSASRSTGLTAASALADRISAKAPIGTHASRSRQQGGTHG